MKLLKLTIRNIASIERGDIDFAHGITAPLFLICGDTGAGKTVILDCIAMALYKTTPRVKSVADVQRNTFGTGEGEQMSVSAVEQYTRLGIGPKDECYSEVSFEGNDGLTYTARLTLGMVNRRKGKGPGHRPASWKLRCGDGSEIGNSGEVGAAIVKAVGLTFEQFCRIAMLAQGQFATFLVGEKKEREQILEQLTNTERFSRYGEAIARIFSRATDEKKDIDNRYNAEKAHILPTEEKEQMSARLAELRAEDDKRKAQAEAEAQTIATLKAQAQAAKAEAEATEALRALQATQATPEYKAAEELVAGWDATTHERQALRDKRDATAKRDKATARLATAAGTFATLAEALRQSDRQREAKREEAGKTKQWIAGQQPWADVYAAADRLDMKLQQLGSDIGDIATLESQAKAEAESTGPLRKAVEQATQAAKDAEEAVAAKQKEIDEANARRDTLDPKGTARQLAAATTRAAALEKLADTLATLAASREEIAARAQRITTAEKELTALEAQKTEAAKRQTEAAQANDKALGLLTTMRQSIGDYLTDLRRKLAADHATTCPLCGQKIETLHLDDEFHGMLTPLEHAQAAAKAALGKANEALTQAERSHATAAGALQADKATQAKTENNLRLREAEAAGDAQKLGLDTQAELPPQVEKTAATALADITRLEEKQSQAESILTTAEHLRTEKKPLDKALRSMAVRKAEAEAKQAANLREVKRLAEELQQKQKAVGQARGEIAAAIGTLLPQWDDDREATRQTIATRANIYKEKREALAKAEAELQSRDQAAKAMHATQELCRAIVPGGEGAPIGKAPANLQDAWTKLYAELNAIAQDMADSTATIERSQAALAGADEAALAALAAREPELKAARKLIADTSAGIRSRHDAIAEAGRQQAANALPPTPDEEGMDTSQRLELHTARKQEADERRHAIAAETGAVGSRLDDDARRQADFRRLEAERQAAGEVWAKWDKMNKRFGGTRLRTLVQSYILRPLLQSANNYLARITDQYRLTCSDDNEKLSVLVVDRYNKGQVRSATVLSGGERFMVSLALSLALSSLGRTDMAVDILFIDEGFGTLDARTLDSVMDTLARLQDIAGQSGRRVGVISHREELVERIPAQIRVRKCGQGRSRIELAH